MAYSFQSLPRPSAIPFVVLRDSATTGYDRPSQHILSDNLKSAVLAPDMIEEKLFEEVALGRASFMCSPLGLVRKPDGGYRRTHHLSHPPGCSTNDGINADIRHLQYPYFDDVVNMILEAGRGCVVVKRDIAYACRNIPVAPHERRLPKPAFVLVLLRTYYLQSLC